VKRKENVDFANKVHECLAYACMRLGMKVEEPCWIELPNPDNISLLGEALDNKIAKFGRPSIVMLLVPNDTFY
jgi:hypothetical protein